MIKFSRKQQQAILKPFMSGLEVYEGTPRSGKTTALVFRLARFYFSTTDRNHLVIGFNQEQAFRLFMDCDGFGLMHIYQQYATIKEDRYGAHLELNLGEQNIKRIYYRGGGKADSFKAFQGLSFGSVVFLEIDLLHMNTIQEAFRRTMASQYRCHFADLNPPSPNHPVITDVFKVQTLHWVHWTMDDNPAITEDRKKEIYATLKKNPYLFKRDFLGERCTPQGVIYSMFDYDIHLTNSLPNNPIELYFCADGGLSDATAVSAYLVSHGRKNYILHRVATYYYSGRDSGNVKAMSIQAKEIAENFMIHVSKKVNMRYSYVFIDPACRALREELALFNVRVQRADNNAKEARNGAGSGIRVGIERVQNLLATNRLKVCDIPPYDQSPLLREIALYVMDKQGKPIDAYNHTLDELRYSVNYFSKKYN